MDTAEKLKKIQDELFDILKNDNDGLRLIEETLEPILTDTDDHYSSNKQYKASLS